MDGRREERRKRRKEGGRKGKREGEEKKKRKKIRKSKEGNGGNPWLPCHCFLEYIVPFSSAVLVLLSSASHSLTVPCLGLFTSCFYVWKFLWFPNSLGLYFLAVLENLDHCFFWYNSCPSGLEPQSLITHAPGHWKLPHASPCSFHCFQSLSLLITFNTIVHSFYNGQSVINPTRCFLCRTLECPL